MSNKSNLDVIILTCGQCRRRYDLAKETRLAESKRKKDLECPHCEYKLGELKR